jgi:S-adenosylmethionine decarboxylase
MEFGSHFMLHCYGCPKEKLKDVGFIFSFLDSFPQKIKMTKVAAPHVFKYSGNSSENWGVSGVVLIAESHISIHTFPDQEHVFVDIFSSKGFNTGLARQELMKAFEADSHKEELVAQVEIEDYPEQEFEEAGTLKENKYIFSSV